MSKLSELLERLIEEKNELEQRLGSLEIYVNSNEFKNLSYVEMHLIRRQKESMQHYLNTLRARISLYEDFNKI